jgi:hypothetical protein
MALKARLKRSGKTTLKKSSTGTVKRSNFKRSGSGTGTSKFQGVATGYAGVRGFRQAKTEKVKAEDNARRRSIPWNLYIKPGSSAKTVILDKEGYFMYEHELKSPNGRDRIYERCIKETGNCPLCSREGREGYYVMKLTCLDMRGYQPKAGAKNQQAKKAVRRIMNVKQGQMPKFERFYLKNGKSFQGLKLTHNRDGEKESVIGMDIEVVGKLTAAQIAKYGDEAKSVDFEEAFPTLTEEAMAKRYGVSAVAGASDFDNDDEDEDDDEDGWG